MVTRRNGREWALQLLVQFDLNPPCGVNSGDSAVVLPSSQTMGVDECIAAFWDQQAQLEVDAFAEGERDATVVLTSGEVRDQAALVKIRDFTEKRVRGVWVERDDLDALLEDHLKNWALYRLGTVERNVLRLGLWELKHCDDIPAPIIVNEAIDLAKYFSESRSGRFVNGILDHLAKLLRNASANEEETFVPPAIPANEDNAVQN